MGGSSPRGVTCVAHVFTGHVRADPGLVWTAPTSPGQSAAAGTVPYNALGVSLYLREACFGTIGW